MPATTRPLPAFRRPLDTADGHRALDDLFDLLTADPDRLPARHLLSRLVRRIDVADELKVRIAADAPTLPTSAASWLLDEEQASFEIARAAAIRLACDGALTVYPYLGPPGLAALVAAHLLPEAGLPGPPLPDQLRLEALAALAGQPRKVWQTAAVLAADWKGAPCGWAHAAVAAHQLHAGR